MSSKADVSRAPSGKKNRRMRRLAQAGLFVFIKLPAPPKKPAAAPRLKEEVYDSPMEPAPTGLLSHSQLKRAAMQQDGQHVKRQQPAPFDGSDLPDPAEGWQTNIPNDVELHLVGVRCIRMSDGSCVKFYRVLVRPSIVKAKQKKVRNLLRDIARDDAKAAKRRVRALVAMLRP